MIQDGALECWATNRGRRARWLTVFRLFRYARLWLRPLVALGVQQPQIIKTDARRTKATEQHQGSRGLDGDCMVPAGCWRPSLRLDFLPVKLAGYEESKVHARLQTATFAQHLTKEIAYCCYMR